MQFDERERKKNMKRRNRNGYKKIKKKKTENFGMLKGSRDWEKKMCNARNELRKKKRKMVKNDYYIDIYHVREFKMKWHKSVYPPPKLKKRNQVEIPIHTLTYTLNSGYIFYPRMRKFTEYPCTQNNGKKREFLHFTVCTKLHNTIRKHI